MTVAGIRVIDCHHHVGSLEAQGLNVPGSGLGHRPTRRGARASVRGDGSSRHRPGDPDSGAWLFATRGCGRHESRQRRDRRVSRRASRTVPGRARHRGTDVRSGCMRGRASAHARRPRPRGCERACPLPGRDHRQPTGAGIRAGRRRVGSCSVRARGRRCARRGDVARTAGAAPSPTRRCWCSTRSADPSTPARPASWAPTHRTSCST